MEDELYFEDLSKQIAMLIMEGEEEDQMQIPVVPWKHSSSCFQFQFQGFLRTTANQSFPPPSMYEEQHCRRSETSKGTGVFIPKLSQTPRRRNRQGRGRRTSSHKHEPPQQSHDLQIRNRKYPSQLPKILSTHQENSEGDWTLKINGK